MLNNGDVEDDAQRCRTFFPDVNYTYSIFIFLSTDNIFIFLCNLNKQYEQKLQEIEEREREREIEEKKSNGKLLKFVDIFLRDTKKKYLQFAISVFSLVTRLASVHSTN